MYVGRMVLVSVPYGDIFYFYRRILYLSRIIIFVSVPYGDLFYFYDGKMTSKKGKLGFRPLWGSFLFLS